VRRSVILLLLAVTTVSIGALFVSRTWHISLWNSLYCSIGTASTVGCNTTPSSSAGQLIAMLIILIAVPLMASAFAIIQNIHLHKKIDKSIDSKLSDHHQAMKDYIDSRNNV
jgi:Ion channel